MATDKLHDLIETLKKQGVQKGEDAAAQIVENAKKEAEAILAEARTEAEAIIAKANSESEQVLKRLQSSMEIAASQFVGNLKRVIENSLLTVPLKDKLSEQLGDEEFLKELITRFVKTYAENPQNPDIQLLLPDDTQESLKDYALDLMVKHNKSNRAEERLALTSHGIKFGFQVDKKDGNVRLDFTDEAFLELFVEFLTPKFRKLFKDLKIGETPGK